LRGGVRRFRGSLEPWADSPTPRCGDHSRGSLIQTRDGPAYCSAVIGVEVHDHSDGELRKLRSITTPGRRHSGSAARAMTRDTRRFVPTQQVTERSRIGIVCRSRPWQHTATISLASLTSTRQPVPGFRIAGSPPTVLQTSR
jgi:hypothetical protein